MQVLKPPWTPGFATYVIQEHRASPERVCRRKRSHERTQWFMHQSCNFVCAISYVSLAKEEKNKRERRRVETEEKIVKYLRVWMFQSDGKDTLYSRPQSIRFELYTFYGRKITTRVICSKKKNVHPIRRKSKDEWNCGMKNFYPFL